MQTHKRYAVAVVFALAAFLLINIPNCFGQSTQLRANIPFDFYVGAQLMPAGTYMVQSVGAGTAIQVSDGGRNSAFLLTHAAKNRQLDKSRMVFRRYGSEVFLSELYWTGFDLGRAVKVSERELQAKNNLNSVTVQLDLSGKK
jgi:hypothetical protein